MRKIPAMSGNRHSTRFFILFQSNTTTASTFQHILITIAPPSLGWKSIPYYGNEYSLGYELISKSGFGFGLDVTKGLVGLDAKTNDQ